MWTVFDDPNQDGGDKHKFMILSQKSSTMVSRIDIHRHDIDREREREREGESILIIRPFHFQILQTGDEINEIENTGFCNTQTTIHVGNLGNNRYIAQILSKNIRLLQGTRLLQNIQIDIDSPLNLVSLVDPYICVKTESGQVITLALRETKGVPRLAVNKNTISSVSYEPNIHH